MEIWWIHYGVSSSLIHVLLLPQATFGCEFPVHNSQNQSLLWPVSFPSMLYSSSGPYFFSRLLVRLSIPLIFLALLLFSPTIDFLAQYPILAAHYHPYLHSSPVFCAFSLPFFPKWLRVESLYHVEPHWGWWTKSKPFVFSVPGHLWISELAFMREKNQTKTNKFKVPKEN